MNVHYLTYSSPFMYAGSCTTDATSSSHTVLPKPKISKNHFKSLIPSFSGSNPPLLTSVVRGCEATCSSCCAYSKSTEQIKTLWLALLFQVATADNCYLHQFLEIEASALRLQQ